MENLTAPQKKMLALLEQAFYHYRQQDWDRAEMLFRQLGEDSDDRLYQIHLESIAQFRKDPPPENWDGVYTHQAK